MTDSAFKLLKIVVNRKAGSSTSKKYRKNFLTAHLKNVLFEHNNFHINYKFIYTLKKWWPDLSNFAIALGIISAQVILILAIQLTIVTFKKNNFASQIIKHKNTKEKINKNKKTK